MTMPSALKSNTVGTKDWLERTKDMSIEAFINPDDFTLTESNDQDTFTKQDFEKDLKKVARKVKK